MNVEKKYSAILDFTTFKPALSLLKCDALARMTDDLVTCGFHRQELDSCITIGDSPGSRALSEGKVC